MKDFRNLIAILLFVFSPSSLYSAEVLKLPEGMMFQGKPISPLCIDKVLNADESVNLSECASKTKIKIDSKSKDLINKGFMGFDYSYKEETGYIVRATIYYRYLGMHGDNYVLETLQSGGGSGFFTSIILLKRQGDHIQKRQTIVTGDRCNGGLDKVEWKDGKLTYSQYISPYDYVSIIEGKETKIKAYDELAACAACCAGEAVFEYDFQKERLLSIQLDPEIEKSTASTQGTLQSCFDKILIDNYIKKGKTTLSPIELKAFVTTFKQTCVK